MFIWKESIKVSTNVLPLWAFCVYTSLSSSYIIRVLTAVKVQGPFPLPYLPPCQRQHKKLCSDDVRTALTMGSATCHTLLFLAGTLLTAHSPTPVAPHPVTVPTYRGPGTPTYSYVPPQWWSPANVSDWWSLSWLLTKVHFFPVENGKSTVI